MSPCRAVERRFDSATVLITLSRQGDVINSNITREEKMTIAQVISDGELKHQAWCSVYVSACLKIKVILYIPAPDS